jgi:hypothetical protein
MVSDRTQHDMAVFGRHVGWAGYSVTSRALERYVHSICTNRRTGEHGKVFGRVMRCPRKERGHVLDHDGT